MRRIYKMLVLASAYQADWEMRMAKNILSSRKKIFFLALMLIPIIIGGVVFADQLPHILGGKKAYAPAFYSFKIFLISIAIGLCAGLITGCIGAGGGFVITPALMSAGIKGILAVGTDLFHIFAKAIMGTVVHKKLGNVSVKLALSFLGGSFLGVIGGGVLNRVIYELSPVMSDAFISLVYVFLLGFLGTYALLDFLKSKNPSIKTAKIEKEESNRRTLPSILQKINIPPMISFDEDLVPGGKRISCVFVMLCGGIVGFVAAIMGVGGGFLTFPMFVYVLGVSSFTTVGTDIFQIIFTAGFASITQYAVYGYIFYTLAMGMLLGSLLGIQIGALTTKVVKGIYIRGFYATAILAGFANRLLALPGKLADMKIVDISSSTCRLLSEMGNYVFFIIISIFAIWVISKFFGNISLLREEG
ncbi:sulfite exporter TauE/SafE family protein [Desulfonauticus submarinus]